MKQAIKTPIIFGACVASMLAPGAAYADGSTQEGWYAGASGDLTWLRHSDTGGGGNVVLGYEFMPSNFGDFRFEGEAGYHGAGGDSGYGSTHYFTYMGNVYYDFNSAFSTTSSGWHIVPYIGGGMGDAAIHYGSSSFTTTFHHHENEFAYDGMAGLSLVSSSMPNTTWSLGYRYLGNDNDSLRANNLELGVRFHF